MEREELEKRLNDIRTRIASIEVEMDDVEYPVEPE